MTEQAPSGLSALDKERAKLEKQRAKLDHQEDVLRREEAFGKYDDNVTPAEGEVTYEQYLGQRPAEGVIRDGDGFRHAQSGNFASREQYEAQLSQVKAADSARENNELENEGMYEVPQYDEMTLSELAQAVNDAQYLGDRAAVEQAREEAQERFTMEIVNEGDDDESSEAAQERFDKMMHRFDALVESTVTYNGEKVVKGDAFEGPGGKKVFEVVDADGKMHLVYEGELTDTAPVEKVPVEAPVLVQEPAVEAPALVEPAPVDGEVHLETTTDEDGKQVTRVSVLPPKDTPVETTAQVDKVEDVQEKGDTKQASRVERVKELFNKKGGLREMLGMKYWEKRWHNRQKQRDQVLDHDVVETDTPEKAEAKRKRGRYILLAGAAAVAALAAGTLVGNVVKSHDAQEAEPTGVLQTPHFTESTVPVEAEVPPVEAPEVAIPPEVFNIPSGGGGEELFETAGIDPRVWYNNEATLLAQFPNDFYLMNDGHVGIAHPGMLSQGAQDYIQSLK